MSDLRLGTDKDLYLENDAIELVTGTEAISQQIAIRLQFFLGEWFMDAREGMPYFRDILVKNPNLALVNATFKQAIEEVPNILRVDKLTTEISASLRTLTVNFSATTTSGETIAITPFIIEI